MPKLYVATRPGLESQPRFFFLFVGRFPEGQIFLLFSSGNGFSPLIFQGFLSKLRAGSFA